MWLAKPDQCSNHSNKDNFVKHLLTSTILAFGLASAAHSAVIATLQETDTGGVLFSIDVTNPDDFDYSGFNADHLDYIFFDNFGDFVDGAALGSDDPAIFQPVSHGTIGNSADGYTIGIQAIVLDNDVGNDPDDFALRFIGQTPGLERNVTPLNFASMIDYSPVLIRNLNFSVLNEGTYTSSDAQSTALGGFQLNVVGLAPVPLPATAPLLAGGIIAAGAVLRRRKKKKQGGS